MAVTLTGSLRAKVDYKYRKSLDVGSTKIVELPDYVDFFKSMGSGTGDAQFDHMYVDRRVVSLASPIDDLDLSGVLTDVFGNTLTFSSIKALLVYNEGVVEGDSDTTGTVTHGEDLKVGGAGAESFAWGALFGGDQDAYALVRSGGCVFFAAPNDGYHVTPGTADVLRIEHDGSEASGGDIAYQVFIGGISA